MNKGGGIFNNQSFDMEYYKKEKFLKGYTKKDLNVFKTNIPNGLMKKMKYEFY